MKGALEDAVETAERRVTSMVFNTFVMCQLFNMLNARKVDDSFNVFSGMRRSYTFVAIWCGIAAFQVIIMMFLGEVFEVSRQDGLQWGVSVAIGLGQLIACVVAKAISRAWAAGRRLRTLPVHAPVGGVRDGVSNEDRTFKVGFIDPAPADAASH